MLCHGMCVQSQSWYLCRLCAYGRDDHADLGCFHLPFDALQRAEHQPPTRMASLLAKQWQRQRKQTTLQAGGKGKHCQADIGKMPGKFSTDNSRVSVSCPSPYQLGGNHRDCLEWINCSKSSCSFHMLFSGVHRAHGRGEESCLESAWTR